MAAARQAGDHAGRDGAGNLGEATLEQLADHVGRLARAYLTGPMFPLFGELAMIRNRAYELLERTERLSQRRDLYLVADQLSCLLAGTSCDLGHSAAAIEQARAARTYAELIDHPSLWAYASGMLSTFFSLEGQHRRALDHARAGLARLGAGHEEYLATLLQHQVADPESTGSIMRIRTTHFPAFMQLRDQRIPECSVAEVVRGDYHGEKTTTTIEPYELAGHRGAMLAIGQRVPNCCHQYFSYDPDDGAGELWFLDPSSGSWASHFHFTPDCTDDEFSIRQHGPRQLWDEVSAAHAWWVEQGRPDEQDWLFTVHPDHQTINLTARQPPTTPTCCTA